MTKNDTALPPSFEWFEIQAAWFQLEPGEKVVPEMVVGRDCETGEVVKAGCYGCVTASYFSPRYHSRMIIIRGQNKADARV